MSFSTLVYENDNGVARITLNRPEVLNASNIRMRDELYEVLSAVRADDETWMLLLRGAGRGFCAGADLTEFGTAPSPTAARHIRFARDVWALLRGLPVPKVAVLHGFVFGSGLEMALFCDLRIAAEGTLLGLPEVQLGLIPAAGGTQTLPRVCGIGPALDLLLTGRRIEATEALRLGLVSQVVPADRLEAATRELVSTLGQWDQSVVQAILRAVHEGQDLPMEQALRLESRLAASVRRPAPAQIQS
ncbi:MAG: enoyl-CoA hydratase/isomerase family protein [Chloroflexota bacterium]|nr:enoyl-CoA hydratase/isomerase family protein [Chloroflexota bacterium]